MNMSMRMVKGNMKVEMVVQMVARQRNQLRRPHPRRRQLHQHLINRIRIPDHTNWVIFTASFIAPATFRGRGFFHLDVAEHPLLTVVAPLMAMSLT